MNDSLHLCACGCGSRTRRDDRGRPRRFLRGHNRRAVGRGWIEAGYRYVSRGGRKIALHRLIVEEREGRRLSSNEVVHHVDRNPLNNDPDNLVVLSRAEHQRLHTSGAKRKRWSCQEQRRAQELRDAGMTLQEVASSIGRPFSSVSRLLCRKRK